MRVFLSSTCYDLIDVRAEILNELNSLGVEVVASDNILSGFSVLPDKNSIETCLANLRNSDEMVIVLDQRYGASLEQAGYDDLSATHLEFKTALAKKIPIRLFIRDRTEADYAVYRKSKDTKSLSWVRSPGDARLFEIIEKHGSLKVGEPRSNWKELFTSSVDLKSKLKAIYRRSVVASDVVNQITSGCFPVISITLDYKLEDASTGVLPISIVMENSGGAPALNLSSEFVADGGFDSVLKTWEDSEIKDGEFRSSLRAGCREHRVFIFDRFQGDSTVEFFFDVDYVSGIGVEVKERWMIHVSIPDSSILTGATLVSRKFSIVEPLSIQLAQPKG